MVVSLRGTLHLVGGVDRRQDHAALPVDQYRNDPFIDLADARRQAGAWCLEVAGQRVHGTTRKLPLVVFEALQDGFSLPTERTG